MKRVFLSFCGLLLLGGCGAPERLVGRPDLQIVQGSELPIPSREDLILERRAYVVGPFDKVDIAVYGVPELTRTVQLDASGRFALPLIGEVEGAGLTPNQLGTLIADRLRGRFVREPQVAVNADTVNQMVTVDGEVERPGLYPVTGRMTLIRAIARAEGLSAYAQPTFVVVFRRVNNQELAALYDLRAIRQGLYPDPEVYANDVVYVGESQARRFFGTLVQASTLLVAPVVAILQR